MNTSLVARSATTFLFAFLAASAIAVAPRAATRAEVTAKRIYVEDFQPSWSPDGRQIVFTRARRTLDPQNGECCLTLSKSLYLMNADGSRLRPLGGSAEDDDDPAWSPDGRWIAFRRLDRLWLVRPDGAGARMVRRDVAEHALPSWSPSGDQIAFLRSRATPGRLAWDIYVVRRDGSGLHRLVPRAELYSRPSWSPNGRHLAFTRDLELWVIAANGSGAHVVSRGGPPPYPKRFSAYYEPAWSPDGAHFVFRSDAGVFVMNADGTGLRRITRSQNEIRQDSHPQWSPNGRQVSFAGYRGGSDEARIYVVAASGRGLTRLTKAPRR